MAERSTISQVVQVGVETTPGTAVAANKRLSSLAFDISPTIETSTFRPSGSKYQTLAILGKEWVEAALSGRATYDEMIYPLSSALTAATVTTPGGGTNSRLWTFKPSVTTEDAPKTFTVEQGSALRAHRFAYGICPELSLSINRDALEVGGSMIGRALEDAITMTAGATTIPLVPILPTQVCAYLDTTAAGIGTTKLTRLLNLEWGISDRYGPLWTIDCDQDSWVTHIEQEPALTCNLTLEADAAGMSFLSQVRAGDTKFLRILATGNIIEGALPYFMQIDMPVKVVDTGGFEDSDGVYAVEWSLIGVEDSTFDGDTGGALKIQVQNTRTAL